MGQTHSMPLRALRDEVLGLPAEDRLRLLEEVWDGLAALDGIPVPSWHLAELERRANDPKEHPTESWEELKTRLLRS